jgi:hypothetical protein
MIRTAIIHGLALSFLFAAQATILHICDTLHILSASGEGYLVAQNYYWKDSINIQLRSGDLYPCTTRTDLTFFATAGNFPVCPCCPSWMLGSPRPFYELWGQLSGVDWTPPLNLQKNNFQMVDSTKTYVCSYPKSSRQICIFRNIDANKTTYMLVSVAGTFLNTAWQFQTSGGQLGYPVQQCSNALIVDIYTQTDGTLNFAGIFNTPAINRRNIENPFTAAEGAAPWQLFDLQGRRVMSQPTPTLPGKRFGENLRGCYLARTAAGMKKVFFSGSND